MRYRELRVRQGERRVELDGTVEHRNGEPHLLPPVQVVVAHATEIRLVCIRILGRPCCQSALLGSSNGDAELLDRLTRDHRADLDHVREVGPKALAPQEGVVGRADELGVDPKRLAVRLIGLPSHRAFQNEGDP